MSQNQRRQLLIVAGALIGAPLIAFAQPTAKPVRIGFLNAGSRQSSAEAGRLAAFLQGMRELGYVEGTHFVLDARFAEASVEQLESMAADLVRGQVKVVVSFGGLASQAAQFATTTIPIVVISTPDPVRDGFAMTLARPGGNLTGLSSASGEYIRKHFELLLSVSPGISRIGVLLNPAIGAHGALLLTVQAVAQSAGKQVFAARAARKDTLERGFSALVRERVDALIVLPDSLIFEQRREIAAFAIKHRLPSIHQAIGFAEAGGLIAYGPDLEDMCRRASLFVDKILKGAAPGELPFELPMRFQLVINLKTAKALSLKIPQSVLMRADRVIE